MFTVQTTETAKKENAVDLCLSAVHHKYPKIACNVNVVKKFVRGTTAKCDTRRIPIFYN